MTQSLRRGSGVFLRKDLRREERLPFSCPIAKKSGERIRGEGANLRQKREMGSWLQHQFGLTPDGEELLGISLKAYVHVCFVGRYWRER